MQVFEQKSTISKFLKAHRAKGGTVGLVPTMGALHQGHLALVSSAMTQNDLVVVSIFVNPTQFNNATDLEKYPRTLDADISKLKKLGDTIVVYSPLADDIYDHNIVAGDYHFGGLEHVMEGEHRPGHFNGVGTIVSKLFEIVQPNRAYFGEKDFQQLAIVRKLVEITKQPVSIVGCPIYREVSGLALSSRNQRLTEAERQQASYIYKMLKKAKRKFGTESATKVREWVQEEFAKHSWLKLEYFEIANAKTLQPMQRKVAQNTYRAFIAVYANDVRLIDNIALN